MYTPATHPLVSILIPAYNVEKYLAETLTSAIGQTWPNKEIIVVDDGSSDNTFEIAKLFEDQGVIVLKQPNKGASAARNTAYQHSKGEYIQFLDGDDLLSPNKIEVQVTRLMQLEQGYVATCPWGRFYTDIQQTNFVKEALWADFSPVGFLETAYNQVLMMQPNVWLCPRSIIEKAGFWNEQLSLNDDGEYFARVVLASKGIVFCQEAKVFYRSGISTSLASRKNRKAYESALLAVKLCAKHLVELEDSPTTRRAAANVIQKFVYDVYPFEGDLIREAENLIAAYGKPTIRPGGPPRFKLFNMLFPWKLARKLERQTDRMRGSRTRLTKSNL